MTIKDNIQSELRYYDFLSRLVLHESKAVWETGQLFLISNSFLAAILGTNFPDKAKRFDLNNILVFWLLAILGLIISVLWHFSFERTKRYYRFRMYQARKWEKDWKKKHPSESIKIFSGDAELLASGGVLKIDAEKCDLKVNGINLSSLTIVNLVIVVFILFYLFICIYFFPWVLIFKSN